MTSKSRRQRNMLFISDERTGSVCYTVKRRRSNVWMEYLPWVRSLLRRCLEDGGGSHAVSDSQKAEQEIAVWKGSSATGRPHFVLRGALHNMQFDVLTTSCPHYHNQQPEQEAEEQKPQRWKNRKSKKRVVGVVAKDLFNMHGKLSDDGRYGIYVQAGYDSALFVLLAMLADEVFHKDESMVSQQYTRDATRDRGGESGQSDLGRGREGSDGSCEETENGKSERMGNAEEERCALALMSALGLGHKVVGSSSSSSSFSDLEDRIRDKVLMLEEHLTDSSDTEGS